MIDYVMGNKKVRGEMKQVSIGDRMNSDYHPVEMILRRKVDRKEWRGERRKVRKGVWDKGKREFKRSLGRVELMGRNVGEEWREMEEKIRGALKNRERDGKERSEKERMVGWGM